MSNATKTEYPIIAYEIYSQTDMPLIPAPFARPWMDATQSRFAYRCLPLTLANQAGWFICNPSSFSVRWKGGARPEDTQLVFDDPQPDNRISSLFGHGTITWNMPYLFRTSERLNLWVKGPSNWPKDGAQPLEGMVEADWTSASFTMNWKITRADHIIRFERGEPICMIVPYPRGLLEACQPKRQPLAENDELSEAYYHWSQQRNDFQQKVAEGDADASNRGWQKDYFQGRDPGSKRFNEHQTKFRVREFESD